MNALPEDFTSRRPKTGAARSTLPGTVRAEPVDLHAVISGFRRRARLFGIVTSIVFLAIAIFTLQMAPKYTATANLMLDPRTAQVSKVQDVLSAPPPDTTVVDTEVEVLRSRQLAERVTAELRLDNDPYFNRAIAKPGLLGSLRNTARSILAKRTPDPAKARLTIPTPQRTHEEVVNKVAAGLEVSRAALTYVIALHYTSDDPQKSAAIANAFAKAYLASRLEVKFDATSQANAWLSERLEGLRGQVQQAEAAVEQYKIANRLLSSSGATLTEQEISAYNQSVAAARALQAEAEAKLNTARSQLSQGSNGDDVGAALDSPVIQQLRRQRAEASAKVADLAGRYGPRHPDMLKAQRELADIDAGIQVEIRRVISNLQAQAQVARQRTASVQGSLSGAKNLLEDNNRASVSLRELERNAEAVRTLYESFLNRFKETSTQQGAATSEARMVSAAQPPTRQSAPNVPLNLAMGLVIGLGAGALAVILMNMLDTGLVTADDVERRLDLPHLASLPLLSSVVDNRRATPVNYLAAKPFSSFAETFRALRAAILQSKRGEAVRVVMVTSALPGEAKSTTTVGLGLIAAQAGSKVVVVDCDLHRRSVAPLVGIDTDVGLLEVLSGQSTLDQALVRDKTSGVWILPLSHSPAAAADVFGSTAMDKLLEQLSARFDLVLLDAAPALALTDTRTLAPKVDAIVVLIRWRKTPVKAVETALRMLEAAGGNVIGAALTLVNMKEQVRYGYGDAGYYFREYKQYYSN